MKKLMTFVVLVFATTMFMTSCGDDSSSTETTATKTTETAPKKEEAPKAEETPKAETAATAGDPEKGKELFGTKTCATCHALDKKLVGPSIQDIAKKYAETNGDIAKFLSGGSDAIVDTDPAQVAVMAANITGILKDATDAEKADLAAYMASTIK